jgi:nitrogenase-stabilizing/protective protein
MSDFLAGLTRLSSAEDFFGYLQVAYDEHVVAVNRLHILKRFHDYMAHIAGFDLMDDEAKRTVYRDALARAYEDFFVSTPLQEKVFPVFQRGKPGFVALSAIQLLPKN